MTNDPLNTINQQQPRRGGKRPGAGRPRLSPEEKRTMRKVYMAPDVWAAVEQSAAKFGITTSVAVEQMVQASLERATGRKPTDP